MSRTNLVSSGDESLEGVSKDSLVAATLAALGGEHTDVLERGLFLACWHLFPRVMRWADTSLPNPDTFTAALRRLDADQVIERSGKQQRRRRGARRKASMEPGRSGAVRARLRPGGLERALVSAEVLDQVRQLMVDPRQYQDLNDADLVLACVAAAGDRPDEGAIVELAFHRFPNRFAYAQRPEFPDTGSVRAGLEQARRRGWLSDLSLTPLGRARAEEIAVGVHVGGSGSDRVQVGTLRIAAWLESTDGYKTYQAGGGFASTKADELYRLLRLPPTTDPEPVVRALLTRGQALRRVGRGDLARYLVGVARQHNPDVAALAVERGEDGK